MGNGYRKDFHHRLGNPHTSMFLPMLCSRPSLKSVVIPRSGYSPDEADPLSPKIGCMGQVKKRNCRVFGLPTPYKLAGNSRVGAIKTNNMAIISCSQAKYSKLRKLFSSKSLLAGTAAGSSPSSAVTTSMTSAAAARRRSVSKSCSFGSERGSIREAVNMAEMDPPLPVVKRVRKPAEEEEEEGGSLWQRRFGGVAPHLRSLEIQRNNPRHHLRLVSV